MFDRLKYGFGWITDADWKTWVGHGLLGALVALVGFAAGVGPVGVGYAVFAAFFYREISDLASWASSDDPGKKPLQAKLKDGFIDLWAPLAGAAIVGLFFR